MRGTPSAAVRIVYDVGIIPAYAGNTSQSTARTPPAWDHPRVCGEHKITAGGASMEAGSSPRMRGTLMICRCTATNSRIIPAYAGNTCTSSMPIGTTRDHPRVCGEHFVGGLLCFFVLGSSPRMRGTPDLLTGPDAVDGIIPAYAGNTRSLRPSKTERRDHPRVCGEHSLREHFGRPGQ